MVHRDRSIVTLIRIYAAASGISVSYAAKVITGSGDTVSRIEAGMSLTCRRAEKIINELSVRWPTNVEWPQGIERPEPRGEKAA